MVDINTIIGKYLIRHSNTSFQHNNRMGLRKVQLKVRRVGVELDKITLVLSRWITKLQMYRSKMKMKKLLQFKKLNVTKEEKVKTIKIKMELTNSKKTTMKNP